MGRLLLSDHFVYKGTQSEKYVVQYYLRDLIYWVYFVIVLQV